MDIKELSELARTHTEAILSNQLSKIEVIALLSLIEARIMSKVYSDVPKMEIISREPAGKGQEVKSDHPIEERKPSKPVAYDPIYDPKPPFSPDPVPERPVSTRVLAEPGHACVCAACAKISYMVNKVIKDGDKVDDFLASYTPVDDMPKLTRKIEIMNVEGQISTDCPRCHSNKSLYLTGRPSYGGGI